MGHVLQVRVYAYTYDEDDVRKAWPKLWKLAFEEHVPGFLHEQKGVLELIRALDEVVRYHAQTLADPVRRYLETDLPTLNARVETLAECLADWRPREANAATDAIEDGLGELEKKLPRF